MTPAEAALVLAKAASFDNRTVGREDSKSWAEALHGLDLQRCMDAVIKHYSESTDRIMPAHVRRLARTTTDITHGDTASTATITDDGGSLCGACKGVHRVTEACSVLKADDSRWRRCLALGRGRAMPVLSAREVEREGGETPPVRAARPAREFTPEDLADQEARREASIRALVATYGDAALQPATVPADTNPMPEPIGGAA